MPNSYNMSSSVKKEVKRVLFRRDGNKCKKCEKQLTMITATIDHIIPASKGGRNNLDNFMLLCEKCNHEKDNDIDYENLSDDVKRYLVK